MSVWMIVVIGLLVWAVLSVVTVKVIGGVIRTADYYEQPLYPPTDDSSDSLHDAGTGRDQM